MHATATLPQVARQTATWKTVRMAGELRFLLVTITALLLLFVSMDLRVNVYDEGLILTAAMRESAGQIPHRDFYFAYGPAQTYLLAGLFRLFGPSVLVARLLDLAFKALLVASLQALLLRLVDRRIAHTATAWLLLFLAGLVMPGSAAVPISLLMLWAVSLLLSSFAAPLSDNRAATRQAFVSGLLTALATLFRYDIGIALAGTCLTLLALAALLRRQRNPPRLRQVFIRGVAYLAGYTALLLPAAIAYLSVASFADLRFDVFDYAAHLFRAGRSLPFPVPHFKTLDDLAIYLPFLVIAVALAAAAQLSTQGPTLHRPAFHRRAPGSKAIALVAFSLLATVMSLKGIVRVSVGQMYLALVPTAVLLAVLVDVRNKITPALRLGVAIAVGVACVSTLWLNLHKLKDLQASHSSMLESLLRPAARIPPGDPLHRGIPGFETSPDQQHAIDFIRSHTSPSASLYVGVTHHDRIFANDNLTYFAAQRLPATRWSEFDPGLQNQLPIQQQMTADLDRHPPPYVLIDAEFDQVREPNASARSSGVTLLDDYLADHYEFVQAWGQVSAWQRRGATRSPGIPLY